MPAKKAVKGRRLSFALAFGLVLGACSQNQNPSPEMAGNGDIGRGKQIYLAQCTMCHNRDPAQDGPLGPAIKGSPRELLEAKVVRGTYPPGYKPKRESAIMKPMPHLATAIPDLATFLK